MIGHGADLPKDFETLVMVDAGQIKRNLKASAMWKQAREVFDIKDEDLPDAPADAKPTVKPTDAKPDANEPAEADSPVGVGTEWASTFEMLTSGRITIATGPGTAVQSLELLRLMNLFQRMSTREALMDYAQSLDLIEEQEGSDNPFTGMLKDKFDPLLASLEKMTPPVVWIAIEAKGKDDKIKEMLAQWDTQMADLPPFVQKSEKEIGGGKFVAFTIKAADMISLDDLKEGLAEDLPVDKIEKLHAVMASKQLSFGFGVRNESLVLFLAPNADALALASTPAESMAARPEFEFLTEAKGKNPFFVAMSTAQVNGNLRAGVDNGFYADVLEEVLGKITRMGDLRDVIALVNKAGTTIRDLSKGTDTAFCGAGWMETDGVRFEALGGADSPQLDGSQPLAFAGGLASEDTVLAVHSRANPVYTEKAMDLLEDLSEIAYELGHRYASSEAGKEKGMNEQFVLFRDKMLPHVISLWKSMRGQVGPGVGQESAFIMDLGAVMPKIPGLPEALVSKGRIPRMAMVYPVTDRAKLQGGWQAMQPALKGLLDAIPMPEDKKLNLPDAFTSEKDGLKTYFYGFSGITNDDFMPSVSVSDKFFFISSSKNLSEMLATKLAALQAKPDAPRGMTFDLRLGPVVNTSLEWLDLVKANAPAVFPSESDREEFLGNEPDIRKALEWGKAFDGMSLKRAPEGSRWRTSLHFKMKAK